MDSPGVTLVVKTPNQKIQDLHIACALEWTVKQLKGHISSVYPTKPESENQKLIYSGQLLRDQLLLKDVLREHEEGKSHTVHLVCSMETEIDYSTNVMDTSKSNEASPSPTPSTPTQTAPHLPPSSSDGLRYRGPNTPSPLNYPLHYMYHQQMMHAATRQGQMPGNMYQVPPMVPPPYWIQMMAQQAAAGRLPIPTQLFNHPANFAYPQMPYPWFPQAGNIHGMPAMPAMPPSPVAQAQQIHQPHPVQAPPQQERQQANRNVQVNANVDPAFDADEDEDNLNQDWLDKIYTLCRIGILLSIVWFYSTTGRFVMLMVFMILVCLYQNGVFHYFVRNRNNGVHNPEQQQQQQQDQGPPQAQQDGREQTEANGSQGSSSGSGEDGAGEDDEESESTSNNEDTAAPAQTPPARPSIVVVAFNFVTTFFTSLVPHGDPVVGQN